MILSPPCKKDRAVLDRSLKEKDLVLYVTLNLKPSSVHAAMDAMKGNAMLGKIRTFTCTNKKIS